jgi:hypothetical protein
MLTWAHKSIGTHTNLNFYSKNNIMYSSSKILYIIMLRSYINSIPTTIYHIIFIHTSGHFARSAACVIGQKHTVHSAESRKNSRTTVSHWLRLYMSKLAGLAGGPKPGTSLARPEPGRARCEPDPCQPGSVTGSYLGRRRGTAG